MKELYTMWIYYDKDDSGALEVKEVRSIGHTRRIFPILGVRLVTLMEYSR
jgi:hypothetical protein